MQFIDDENANVYNKQGLTIANPVRSAFMFVSVSTFFALTYSQLVTHPTKSRIPLIAYLSAGITTDPTYSIMRRLQPIAYYRI